MVQWERRVTFTYCSRIVTYRRRWSLTYVLRIMVSAMPPLCINSTTVAPPSATAEIGPWTTELVVFSREK
jgi:hypothetical protein